MPAYQVPMHVPTPIDDCLLDEEFDIVDIMPSYNRKPGLARLLLVSGDTSWDEVSDDDDVDFI